MFEFSTRYLRQLAGAAIGIALSVCPAAAETTLDVLYTTPGTFTALQQDLAKRFSEAHPEH